MKSTHLIEKAYLKQATAQGKYPEQV
uniref:Uncharacterized protein n=1 Tax=Arundo donax TaxID=35708 RepID=A0A0A8YHE9_ARUDO